MSNGFFSISLEMPEKAMEDIETIIANSEEINNLQSQKAIFNFAKSTMPEWFISAIIEKNKDSISKEKKVFDFFTREAECLNASTEPDYKCLLIESQDDNGNPDGIAEILHLVMKNYEIETPIIFEVSFMGTPGRAAYVITKDEILHRSTDDCITEMLNSLKKEQDEDTPGLC